MIKTVTASCLAAVFFFTLSVCFADVVKGTIEKVNIKSYEITVSGTIVKVSKASVFTHNDLGLVKNVIIRDINDHLGQSAVCYGDNNKEGIFEAYKVKIVEGHK